MKDDTDSISDIRNDIQSIKMKTSECSDKIDSINDNLNILTSLINKQQSAEAKQQVEPIQKIGCYKNTTWKWR